MSITENIQSQLDQNKFCAEVFVDLKKAFDKVNHEIVLKKLCYYGIRGIANKLLCSYLTKRKWYVIIRNQVSTLNEISRGAPQGSVLGLLLFHIYINHLHKCIRNSRTYHFADDSSIMQSQYSLQISSKRINKDLSNCLNWLKANKLSLNVKKTKLYHSDHLVLSTQWNTLEYYLMRTCLGMTKFTKKKTKTKLSYRCSQ